MPIPRTLINAEHLKVTIGSKTILDDLNFTVRWGEGWAIVGPSGIGFSGFFFAAADRSKPISARRDAAKTCFAEKYSTCAGSLF